MSRKSSSCAVNLVYKNGSYNKGKKSILRLKRCSPRPLKVINWKEMAKFKKKGAFKICCMVSTKANEDVCFRSLSDKKKSFSMTNPNDESQIKITDSKQNLI